MAMKRYKAEEIVAKLRLWLADGSCIRLRPQHRELFGPTTLSRTAPMMDAGIACSTCSTSLPTNEGAVSVLR
jgi:hypothetical protein